MVDFRVNVWDPKKRRSHVQSFPASGIDPWTLVDQVRPHRGLRCHLGELDQRARGPAAGARWGSAMGWLKGVKSGAALGKER